MNCAAWLGRVTTRGWRGLGPLYADIAADLRAGDFGVAGQAAWSNRAGRLIAGKLDFGAKGPAQRLGVDRDSCTPGRGDRHVAAYRFELSLAGQEKKRRRER